MEPTAGGCPWQGDPLAGCGTRSTGRSVLRSLRWLNGRMPSGRHSANEPPQLLLARSGSLVECVRPPSAPKARPPEAGTREHPSPRSRPTHATCGRSHGSRANQPRPGLAEAGARQHPGAGSRSTHAACCGSHGSRTNQSWPGLAEAGTRQHPGAGSRSAQATADRLGLGGGHPADAAPAQGDGHQQRSRDPCRQRTGHGRGRG